MTMVTLLNGSVQSHYDVHMAMLQLEHLRAMDRFAFTEFVEHCRSENCSQKVKAVIRDVAISSTKGEGLDMQLLHPVRLSALVPGMQIDDLSDLDTFELNGSTVLKITGKGLYAGDEVPMFVRLELLTPNACLLRNASLSVEMQKKNGVSSLGNLNDSHLRAGTQLFIAHPDEYEGLEFSNYGGQKKVSAEALARWRAPKGLMSPANMYQNESIAGPAGYYRNMMYAFAGKMP